jgi:branched-chain amino acid transport system ATP-binding protein
MSLLAVKNLTKRFGGITAVDDCSFDVREGTITALIGPNGAGKSTAFNLINGVLKPDAGTVHFEDEDITNKRPSWIMRRGISRTFQITRDLKEMTVLENVVVQSPVQGFRGLFRSDINKVEHERAMSLLEFVGIAKLANLRAKNLSYGQKKLMELAGVMMSDPKMIMLDEPAGGVNPALLETIIDRIITLHQQGITFFIVEHNMDMVMQLCDPVIVMAYGSVLAIGPPEDIQQNKTVLEAYLGD